MGERLSCRAVYLSLIRKEGFTFKIAAASSVLRSGARWEVSFSFMVIAFSMGSKRDKAFALSKFESIASRHVPDLVPKPAGGGFRFRRLPSMETLVMIKEYQSDISSTLASIRFDIL